MLFNKRLLQTHLNSFEYPQTFDFERAEKIIGNWQKAIKDGNYDKTKEIQVQSSFLNLFFNIILGYAEMHDNSDEWFLMNEAKTELDGTKADGALGYFTKDEKSNVTRAVIELKDAKTHLTQKQSTRKDYDSPVSQAFSYSSKFDRCDWIIVSNFKEIRLYNKERGQGYFESFEILNLSDEKEFKRFYFLLCKQNLLDKNRNSLLDNLVKDTTKNEEEITKEFYKDFKALRQELFQHICEHNPDIDKKSLLEKTQKLLDRFIFIFFCEDTNGLLPMNIIRTVYDLGIKSRERSDTRIWREFKNLFMDIDEGRHDIDPPINAYNGGLFATDKILENLIIKDDIWESIIKLSDYNFESDLNVNILGHIFEQSLSDLEQLKAEIDGIEQDKTKSKRKKDGIFYTPEYITKYIVEQTIGKYLDENPDKLETIKILDPACGSGAFLNQAHTFLKEQYEIRYEEKLNQARENETLNMFEHINIAETDRSILLNNLYGVDLNEESTEITKLALWLKTAKKDQPLQNLDNNIKCGNSLIDDATIAGDKAFNWYEQFPQIFPSRQNCHCEEVTDETIQPLRHSELVSESHTQSQDGFDCIIGNPPYVRAENIDKNQRKYYIESGKFSKVLGRFDLYILFIEKAMNLLKPNGYFAFIIPSSLFNQNYASIMRKWLLEDYEIINILDLSDINVFDGVAVQSTVITIKKKKPEPNHHICVQKLKDITEINDSSAKNHINSNVFIKLPNSMIRTDITNSMIKIIDKVSEQSILLDDICYVVIGAVPHDSETGASKDRLISTEKSLDSQKKYIEGKDMGRYRIEWRGLYLDYQPQIMHRPKFPELFENTKILVRNISTVDGLLATLDINSFYANDTMSICIPWHLLENLKQNSTKSTDSQRENSKKYNLFFLLALINSNLVNFYFKKILSSNLHVYPEAIRNLPILNNPNIVQENLASKAEQMIELNKQLNEGVKSALDLLKAEYQPKKISQNIEKFYTLGVHPFLEELAKQGVKLSLVQKEELLTWYKQKSETLNNIKNQIDTLDHSIDVEVYKLYNLTPEEIQIIAGT